MPITVQSIAANLFVLPSCKVYDVVTQSQEGRDTSMSAVFDQQRQSVAATPGLFLLNPSGNRKFVSGQTSRIGNGRLVYVIVAILTIIAIGIAFYFASSLLRANEVE